MKNRAVRLMHHLSQPFFVAEPFTGRQGEHAPINATLDGVEAILRG